MLDTYDERHKGDVSFLQLGSSLESRVFGSYCGTGAVVQMFVLQCLLDGCRLLLYFAWRLRWTTTKRVQKNTEPEGGRTLATFVIRTLAL